MRELKFREVDEKYKVLEDVELTEGIKIKQFLTWKEFAHIYELIMAQDNSFMRNYAKVVEFAKICTNIDFSQIEDEFIYDICSELGLIFEFKINIEQYEEIDKIIDKEESLYNAIKEISDNLTPQINEAMNKIGDGNELIDKLKGVIGK